jgi:redox-sensitive bicupin YhaK (pirin superfamily)
MITIRKSEARGVANHGWLDSRHTFSFADYYDPSHMGFRALRVINEDRVAAGAGFGTHPHRDMEILSYVLAGAIQHRDSMGNGEVLRPGEVQRMTAGTGVTHSEFNPSREQPLHFLQIWIVPARRGLTPGYEQKAFAETERRGRLRLVASTDGREGSLTIHQDVAVYAGLLAKGDVVEHAIGDGRGVWIHVARGEIDVDGTTLHEGDGAAIEHATRTRITGARDAEILLFDLA